jgi:hypothetical protein
MRNACFGAGRDDFGEHPHCYQEALLVRRAVVIKPGDLRQVVDAAGICKGCVGRLDWGETSAAVEKTVDRI